MTRTITSRWLASGARIRSKRWRVVRSSRSKRVARRHSAARADPPRPRADQAVLHLLLLPPRPLATAAAVVQWCGRRLDQGRCSGIRPRRRNNSSVPAPRPPPPVMQHCQRQRHRRQRQLPQVWLRRESQRCARRLETRRGRARAVARCRRQLRTARRSGVADRSVAQQSAPCQSPELGESPTRRLRRPAAVVDDALPPPFPAEGPLWIFSPLMLEAAAGREVAASNVVTLVVVVVVVVVVDDVDGGTPSLRRASAKIRRGRLRREKEENANGGTTWGAEHGSKAKTDGGAHPGEGGGGG